MPIMIPDPIPDHASALEKAIFETFKRIPQTNWEVLYGVEISSHTTSANPVKIDFVIFIPNQLCVICIVVDPSMNPDRYESPSVEDLDPAKKIMKNLRRSYKGTHFRTNSPLSLGYAAVSHNIDDHSELRIIIPDSDRGIISESLDNLETTLKRYADTLNPELWNLNLDTEEDWDEWRKSWDKAQLALDKLRSDLVSTGGTISTISTMFHDNLETHRPQLLRLTDDQLKVLQLVGCQPPSTNISESDDQINDSEPVEMQPRRVVNGAAGTGKTVLAIEIARQRCEEKGDKVALICSNSYLSSHFERWTKTLSSDKGGSVAAGIIKDFSSSGSQKQEKFDYLIVDEAQNLCDEGSLTSMDQLLEGGLTEGNWTMFGDFDYQNISSENLTETGDETIERLQKSYPLTVSKLKINCRNTYEIAAAVSMLVDIETLPRLGVHGPFIEIEYFDSDSPKNLDNLLDHLVGDLKDRKFFSRQIILLSSSRDNFNTVCQYGGWKLLNVRELHGEKKSPDVSGHLFPKTLRYSDIYDFQGLESEVVILVIPEAQVTVGGDATLPDYDHLIRVLYTGMSRAKAMLIIVAEESYKEHLDLEPDFEPTYKDFIETIAQKGRESNTV